MKHPHDYQENGILKLGQLIKSGTKRLLFQLATGGGKTVVFATIINRFISKDSNNKALIIVHREELLEQAYRTLYDWYGIIAEKYKAGQKKAPYSTVVIGMVETVNNRLKIDPSFFKDYKLAIIDECHLGNHKKIYQYMPEDVILIGCTATPLASSKKHPLNKDFSAIVCGIDIPELIERNFLLPNKTYSPVGKVDLSNVSTSTGDYNDKQMGNEYSKGKHVANTLEQYLQKAIGRKTVIFNCNVEHSMLVNETFLAAGIPSKHLDGETPKDQRREILKWFKETKNAVLQNVGVATTGFDEPSIFCVMINKDTLSLQLYLQMCGRGGRTSGSMDHFVLIDMGGNHERHGDWSDARDWEDIFNNPPKAKKGGLAPMTECPECEALIHASASFCRWCGFVIIREMKIVNTLVEFKLVKDLSPANINVQEAIETNPDPTQWHQEIHAIKNRLVSIAIHRWKLVAMDDEIFGEMLNEMLVNVKGWCKLQKKPFSNWMKDYSERILLTAINKEYGYSKGQNKVYNTGMQEDEAERQKSLRPL